MTSDNPGQHQVVVVGAGHAGGTVAGVLRQQGYAGQLVMLGDEPDPPYHRPPLSKKFTDSASVQWLRPAEFYTDNDIDLRVSQSVSRIDRDGRYVMTDAGERFDYDTLILATGAAARGLPVPGHDLDGVLSLRTLAEAETLRHSVRAGARIAIIGGGYIGLEVAASARAHNCDVVIVEREDRLLARVASPEFADVLSGFHRARGTRIMTDASVVEIGSAADGSVGFIRLGDGTVIECDVVLVGIGAVPNDTLARQAGIECDQGIVVDGAARTSDPSILAIGDVTNRIHDGIGRRMRLESIPSAVEQARQAAAVVMGTEMPKHEVPWFWSDQFDMKMKMAGVKSDGTHAVLRGDPASGSFALFHLAADDSVDSIETVNAAAEFMAGKKYLASRVRLDSLKLADVSVSMREVLLDSYLAH
ncbi:NAD(P)/FAD-dependent oxidoreductase [Rhodococcoides kyotonense]|uniref:3-phenylpropionate/trans-cinnamate dioxygenase ferredoxin reductase subunit n=1 Tax=Rhodococcoides kyotonense TaxID=398843 RepID=A0A239JYP6_9NOCA|nr:FAD-dependent oxidoreductase [Rhodococcus kyotonensis]SNT11136.1 3-phenylpropionate/trans-cinnamate dioxygenase ferredoxin reductase subunit [Rhodococcus kyotonensis]